MKKRFLFLTLCMLLAGCTAFAACGDDKEVPGGEVPGGDVSEEAGFRITLHYDDALGGVTVSDPAEGKLYDADERVTVTVNPNVGYAVSAFTVTGYSDAELTDGKFEFAIASDVEITVGFEKLAYTVSCTVTPDEGGSVALSPVRENNRYEYGEKVSVTATAAEDYILKSVSVGGETVSPSADGKFEITVTSDVEIAVGFVSHAQAVLESLQGSIVFEGTKTEEDYMSEDVQVTVSDLKTTFDVSERAVLMEAYENGEPIHVWLFQEATDGNSIALYHDKTGALLEEEEYDYPFSTLFNPFDLLIAEDLVPAEENAWTIEDAETLDNVINALCGFSDRVEKFLMYEEDNVIVGIEIVFERFKDELGWEDYQNTIEFEVKERGTAKIDPEYFTAYPITEEHETLKTAMQEAAQATSYTVRYQSDARDYTLYYTPEGIYIDETGAERGYLPRADGNIWNYFYDPESEELTFNGIAVSAQGIDYLKAIFELKDNNGEYYVLLKSLGDGKFAARPKDVFDSYGDVASFFAIQLATGLEQIEQIQEEGTVWTFSVTLKGGKLYQVEMDYAAYGEDTEHITLTFGDWNSASVPVEIPAEKAHGLVDAALCGKWASENGDVTLEITLDGVVDAENFTKLDDGGYSYVLNDVQYTVKANGDTLTLSFNGNEVTLYPCAWDFYIGDFIGITEENENLDIAIRANGITVAIGEQTRQASDIVFEQVYVLDDEGYGDYAYEFTFKLGEEKWVLQQAGYGYDRLIFAPFDSAEGVGVTRDKYEELDDWSEFCGEYSGEGYRAVIGQETIEIVDPDGSKTEIDRFKFYRDWDYEQSGYYYQFSFTLDDTACVLEITDHAVLLVLDADREDYRVFYLMDESFEVDYSGIYGVYASDDSLYRVELNENGVTLTFGGETQAVKVVYFSPVETYSSDRSGGYFILKTESGEIYYLSIYPETVMGSYVIPSYGYLYWGDVSIYLTAVEDGSPDAAE